MLAYKRTITAALSGAALVFASVALANSGSNPAVPNPPLKRTGAAIDGGLNCSACHSTFAPANSDPRGRVTINASSYKPGVRQSIRVRVEHPEAVRWGFQLAARVASDPSRQAGSFTQTADVTVRCDDGSVRGVAGPCDGRLEFAMHTAASTRQGTSGGVEWDVEWTPPARDVDDVILYAAGNAADGAGSPQNDRIYTTARRISYEDQCPASRPAITSVVNGASFQPGASLNAMLTVFGRGFHGEGRKRGAEREDFDDNGRFPRQLACVAVEIAGVRAPVVYVQENQINVQAPTVTATGPQTLSVILNPGRANESRSEPVTIQILEASPAFFVFGGTRSIAALVAGTDIPLAPASVSPRARAARPGEIVSLFATGLGVTEPVYQAGEVPDRVARMRDNITVTFGGLTLASDDVLYAGLSPGSISGLYQINIRIPAATGDGDVQVAVQAGGLSSPAGFTIPVRRP